MLAVPNILSELPNWIIRRIQRSLFFRNICCAKFEALKYILKFTERRFVKLSNLFTKQSLLPAIKTAEIL